MADKDDKVKIEKEGDLKNSDSNSGSSLGSSSETVDLEIADVNSHDAKKKDDKTLEINLKTTAAQADDGAANLAANILANSWQDDTPSPLTDDNIASGWQDDAIPPQAAQPEQKPAPDDTDNQKSQPDNEGHQQQEKEGSSNQNTQQQSGQPQQSDQPVTSPENQQPDQQTNDPAESESPQPLPQTTSPTPAPGNSSSEPNKTASQSAPEQNQPTKNPPTANPEPPNQTTPGPTGGTSTSNQKNPPKLNPEKPVAPDQPTDHKPPTISKEALADIGPHGQPHGESGVSTPIGNQSQPQNNNEPPSNPNQGLNTQNFQTPQPNKSRNLNSTTPTKTTNETEAQTNLAQATGQQRKDNKEKDGATQAAGLAGKAVNKVAGKYPVVKLLLLGLGGVFKILKDIGFPDFLIAILMVTAIVQNVFLGFLNFVPIIGPLVGYAVSFPFGIIFGVIFQKPILTLLEEATKLNLPGSDQIPLANNKK